MTRSRLWLLAIAPVLAIAVIAAQQLALSHSSSDPGLQGFASCSELNERYIELALAEAPSRYRFEEDAVQDDGVEWQEEEEAAEEEEAVDFPASGGPRDGGEVSDTGTNVQVRGVDESDIIKTDGAYLYILRPQSLLVAEITSEGPPVEIARIEFASFSFRQELLIGSDRAVVVRQLAYAQTTLTVEQDDVPQPRWPVTYNRPQAEILEVGLADKSAPQLLRELDLHGRFLSARMVGDDLRIAFQHSSPIPWIDEWAFDTWTRADDARRYNEALKENFKLGQWFPLYGLQDHETNEFTDGYAIDCERAYAPDDRLPGRFGAQLPSTAFMLSFDLTEGIGDWGGVAVLGMAERPTVYASRDSLYLAAPHDYWQDTAIHRFDISDPLEPTYFGGAIVEGQLLSQWSLSEHDGYLRVASTNWNRWPTVSSVTVLQAVEDESEDQGNNPTGRLEEVGRVSDLGRTESIFAVRFAGDVGYIVTFRQVDPLYVLDLSDPTNPMEVGELKIPGFSRYLHPLGGGLLLGVGRDADPDTGWALGLQATLFDVSDPANPTQISVLPLGEDAFSPVEHDHRAFRYQDGIAWIPVGPKDDWLRQQHDGAFLGVRVSAEGLSLESALRVHGEARRAFPVAQQVHLLSDEELRTYTADTHTDLGALSFAPEWDNRWLPISPE